MKLVGQIVLLVLAVVAYKRADADICSPEAILALRGITESIETIKTSDTYWLAMCRSTSSEETKYTSLTVPYANYSQFRNGRSASQMCMRRSRKITNEEFREFRWSLFEPDVQTALIHACRGDAGVVASSSESGGKLTVSLKYAGLSDGVFPVKPKVITKVERDPKTMTCLDGTIAEGKKVTEQGNTTVCSRPNGYTGPLTLLISFDNESTAVGASGVWRESLLWRLSSKSELPKARREKLRHHFRCESSTVNYTPGTWVDCRRLGYCSNGPKQLKYCNRYGSEMVSGPGRNLRIEYKAQPGKPPIEPTWLFREDDPEEPTGDVSEKTMAAVLKTASEIDVDALAVSIAPGATEETDAVAK